MWKLFKEASWGDLIGWSIFASFMIMETLANFGVFGKVAASWARSGSQ